MTSCREGPAAAMRTVFPRGRSLVLAEAVALLVSLLGATQADFSDQGPNINISLLMLEN